MADVWRGLNDATAGTGDDGCNPLDRDDPAGVILVAGGCGTLGAIDAAYDRAQREWDDDRQIVDGVAPGFQPLQPKRSQPFGRPERRRRIDGQVGTWLGNQSGPTAEVLDAAAHEERRQCPGNPQGKRDPGGEGREDDAQRHEADQRRGHDLEHREKRDQRQGDRRQAAEQAGPGHDPADRAGERGACQFEKPAGNDPAHPDVPGMAGGLGLGQASVESGPIGGAEDEEHHSEGARRVEPERHCGDVRPACPAGQPKGHPGEE